MLTENIPEVQWVSNAVWTITFTRQQLVDQQWIINNAIPPSVCRFLHHRSCRLLPSSHGLCRRWPMFAGRVVHASWFCETVKFFALAQPPSWLAANSTSSPPTTYWRMCSIMCFQPPTAKFILEIFSLRYLCLSRYATVCLYFRPSVAPTMGGVRWCWEFLPFCWMKLFPFVS